MGAALKLTNNTLNNTQMALPCLVFKTTLLLLGIFKYPHTYSCFYQATDGIADVSVGVENEKKNVRTQRNGNEWKEEAKTE